MGLMYLTVIGYMVCLGFVGTFIMYFLTKAFVPEDATIIDPKPETNY